MPGIQIVTQSVVVCHHVLEQVGAALAFDTLDTVVDKFPCGHAGARGCCALLLVLLSGVAVAVVDFLL